MASRAGEALHNAAMRASVAIRAALVLLCAAGVLVSIVSYRSQRKFDEGFSRVGERRLDDRTRELLEDARPLNPDTRIEQGLAGITYAEGGEWEPYMRRALEREPENVGLAIAYAVVLEAEGRTREARSAYARASELDPNRFPPRRDGPASP